MQSLTRRELLRRGVTVVTAAVLVEWGLVGARRAPAMVVRSQGSAPLLTSDVGALSADEQLLFAALQGIVQSDSAPRIYLLGLDRTSRAWLRDAVPLATQAVAPYDLPLRFRDALTGLVVWDPDLAVDTQNVATTMAGLIHALPVSPALADVLTAAPYHLPVVADLRAQRLRSRAEAYDWAVSHLGPPSRFGVLAWLGDPRDGRAAHGLRDLVVAHRGFAFEADPKKEWQIATRILDAFPPQTQVLGYPLFDDPVYRATGEAMNEPIGVGEISRSGKYLIASTSATNLTVHSSFPPLPQSPTWDEQAGSVDPAMTYVAFLLSDGDNLGYNEQELRTRHWDDPARGSIPMGISISPWLALYAPRIYDHYVRTATANEIFVCGPSGAGYIYPQFESELGPFLAQTRRMMQLTGLRSVWILDNGYAASPTPPIAREYVEALHPSAVFADYGGWIVPNPPAVIFIDGVPVVHALWGPDVGSTVGRIRLAAVGAGSRPAFVLVALSAWTMGFSEAQAVMQRLGPGYRVVRPDRFVGLLKQTRPAV